MSAILEMREAVDSIRERVGMLDLLARDGVAMRRAGAYWMGLCPFHEERSGSFAVGSRFPDRGTCYGCGWKGDIFEYWAQTRGCDFKGALQVLAELAGVRLEESADGSYRTNRTDGVVQVKNAGRKEEAVVLPDLPGLRHLRPEEIGALAALRGLSVEGVTLAAGVKHVGATRWPQWKDQRSGAWRAAQDAAVCWVVTDGSRKVAQFRRLDGQTFTRKDGQAIKCWTKGSPTWPVGTAEIGDKPGVIWVEGGADLLAAWHFVWAFGLQREVGVCAMLGAGCRIAAEALPAFEGKRVRIFMDADVAGQEAAARWQVQLSHAGAVVESFDLEGLVRADGAPVKDLNDLALCDGVTLASDEVRAGFLVWDF